MQKNETKDEMLIHSLKQVITLQKKFMPGNLDHKIEALMVEDNRRGAVIDVTSGNAM